MKRARTTILLLPFVVAFGVAAVAGDVLSDQEARLTEEEIVGCVHYWDSDWDCPEFSSQEPHRYFPVENVRAIRITVIAGDGEHHMEFPLNPEDPSHNVDAVFFTRPAVDKFAMPYYQAIGRSQGELFDIWQEVPKAPR